MEIKGVLHFIADDLAKDCLSVLCACDENCAWFEDAVAWDTFLKWCARWS